MLGWARRARLSVVMIVLLDEVLLTLPAVNDSIADSRLPRTGL
jgi:hypothetical protein